MIQFLKMAKFLLFSWAFKGGRFWRCHYATTEFLASSADGQTTAWVARGARVLVRQNQIWLPAAKAPLDLQSDLLASGLVGPLGAPPPSKVPLTRPVLDGDSLEGYQRLISQVDQEEPCRRGLGTSLTWHPSQLAEEAAALAEPAVEVSDIEFEDSPQYVDFYREVLPDMEALLAVLALKQGQHHSCIPAKYPQLRLVGFADIQEGRSFVVPLVRIHDIAINIHNDRPLPKNLVAKFGSWEAVRGHMATDLGRLRLYTGVHYQKDYKGEEPLEGTLTCLAPRAQTVPTAEAAKPRKRKQ